MLCAFAARCRKKAPCQWLRQIAGHIAFCSAFLKTFAVVVQFFATANGRCDNTDEVVPGTIHFTVAPGYAVDLQVGDHGTATAKLLEQPATTDGVSGNCADTHLRLEAVHTVALLQSGVDLRCHRYRATREYR